MKNSGVILILGIALLLPLAACQTRPFQTVTMYDDPSLFVRLEVDPTVGGSHSQPANITTDEMIARREMASLAFDENALRAYLSVSELRGEPGYSPVERKSARPTLDVNGIWGGFAGEGATTVIPARAGAKVSMRLVPNQNAAQICELFKSFIQSIAPPGIKVTIREFHSNDPVLVSRDQASVQAAARAIEIGFGKAPVFIREGGSIPVVTLFKRILGLDTLLLGWGCADDGAHSPNERLRLDHFHRGIRAAAALMYELAP